MLILLRKQGMMSVNYYSYHNCKRMCVTESHMSCVTHVNWRMVVHKPPIFYFFLFWCCSVHCSDWPHTFTLYKYKNKLTYFISISIWYTPNVSLQIIRHFFRQRICVIVILWKPVVDLKRWVMPVVVQLKNNECSLNHKESGKLVWQKAGP